MLSGCPGHSSAPSTAPSSSPSQSFAPTKASKAPKAPKASGETGRRRAKSSKSDLVAFNETEFCLSCVESCCVICEDTAIAVLADNFGGETSWQLVIVGGENDGELIREEPQGAIISDVVNEFVPENGCLDNDECYEFTIFDSFGDGLCCGFGVGGYTIDFGNEQIVSDDSTNTFTGSSQSEQFGNCGGGGRRLDSSSPARIYAETEVLDDGSTVQFHVYVPSNQVITFSIVDMAGAVIETVFNGDAIAGVPVTIEYNIGDIHHLNYKALITGENPLDEDLELTLVKPEDLII